MSFVTANPIAEALQCLERGELAAAERILDPLPGQGRDADALHILGLVRLKQDMPTEAAGLLRRALALKPGHPHMLLGLAKALSQGSPDQRAQAKAALEEAVRQRPGLAEAWYELGQLHYRNGDLAAAEAALRGACTVMPGHHLAQLALGVTLKDRGRAAEAQTLLAQGLEAAQDPRTRAAFAYSLALAHYDQGAKDAALENFRLAGDLNPGDSGADLSRADLLEECLRPDEAEALLEDLLRRDSGNAQAHAAYNELLHRRGRDSEFLKSYERAPSLPALSAGKAAFLLKLGRTQEAAALFAAAAARDPANRQAAIGAATALSQLGRHDQAMAELEKAAPHHAGDAGLFHAMAATALEQRDPQKAASLAEHSLRLAPVDQTGLAVLGTAWRMMGDERDEMLNGYDELIQVFDLEPPDGFAGMAEFNGELNHWLDKLHGGQRAPLHQSLRGGSQSRGHIFGQSHDLVESLKSRIGAAVERYIAQTRGDPRHPFRGRHAPGFRFAGSWSSRLKDCGFHINHVHPEGWISSCYYVGVPDAVKDESAKQGWITFGQPNLDIGLAPRRALQPRPGRLVLFPSYMWHGTNPFHENASRTTIAFDAIPGGPA